MLGSQCRQARFASPAPHAFKAFGEEFLDAVQGLPTLKAFGQSGAFAAKADRAGTRLIEQHVLGAGARRAYPGLYRSRHRPRRRRRIAVRRLARTPWRDEPGGAADRPDGRHRDFPAVARSARRSAPGHDRPVRCRRRSRAAGGQATRCRPSRRRRRNRQGPHARASPSRPSGSPIQAARRRAHAGL